MMPAMVEAHVRERYHEYEHRTHRTASSAQELAAAEHVSGYAVAKPVVISLDGELVLAVVAATDRVDLSALRAATGSRSQLVSEAAFSERFRPCAAGAEPPLAIFGAPIFVDSGLLLERKILMPAGTHEDALVVNTEEWMTCERVRPVTNLGRHVDGRA
jgi:Ala-tRNA(Pro) deacylase